MNLQHFTVMKKLVKLQLRIFSSNRNNLLIDFRHLTVKEHNKVILVPLTLLLPRRPQEGSEKSFSQKSQCVIFAGPLD